MTQIVGVRWREADPVSYATAEDFTLPMKSYVVVQMEKSQELAWVCRDSKQLVACLPDSDLGMRVVRRAKEQSLPISAEGLAGACGRLRCCLRFEYEQYRQVNKLLPKIGELVGTPSGGATVIVGHRIKETVSVRYDDDRVLELPLAGVVRNQPSRN